MTSYFKHRWRKPLRQARLPRRLLLQTYQGLGEFLSHGGKLHRAFPVLLVQTELAARDPERDGEILEMLSTACAGVSLFSPLTGFAARRARVYLQGAEGLPDPWRRARVVARLALALVNHEPVESVVQFLDESIDTLMRCGEVHDVHASSTMRQALLYHSGQFERLRSIGEEHYRFFAHGESEEGRAGALLYLAVATGGALPLDLVLAECRNPPFENPVAEALLRLAVTRFLLSQGQNLVAARMLARPSRVGFPILAASMKAWEATAWRLAAEQPECPPWRRTVFCRRARRAARRALNGMWAPLRPHALRELALLAAARGRWRLAEARFAASLREAERWCYEHAWTELERERLRRARGLPHRVERAEQRLARMGATWHFETPQAPPPVAVVDLFEQTLQWGRRLIGLLGGPAELYPQLREAAVALLRPQECLVLSWPDCAILAGPPRPFSRTLLERAVELPRAVSADETELSASFQLSRASSVLTTAVRVDGEVVALLYLTHAQVSGLFSEEDGRRIDFLACLAGAALHNARWLAERERVELARLATRRQLTGLLENAGIGLAVLDEKKTIQRSNAWLSQALGQDPVGRPLADFVLAVDQRHLARLGSGLETELRFLRPDRSLLWARCGLRNLDGNSVLSVLDITQRRQQGLARFLEDERRLLSSELHDGVAGDLAALAFSLADPGVDRGQALATVRRLRAEAERLGGCDPHAEETLAEQVARFARESGLPVETELCEPGSGLPAQFCGRIIQEALTNARRHARASLVRVSVRQVAGGLEGLVSDDGVGFDADRMDLSGPCHFGLRGFRLRAELLGGSVDINSRPGQGTRVRFFLPVPGGLRST